MATQVSAERKPSEATQGAANKPPMSLELECIHRYVLGSQEKVCQQSEPSALKQRWMESSGGEGLTAVAKKR